jgi:hypothetical protein
MKSPDQLWGPLDIARWTEVPTLAGRVAIERDVKEGRAVFFLQNAEEIGAKPIAMHLPCCAILKEEEGESPVVLIQAEEAGAKKYVGYRGLGGGNGICALEELELLSGPDSRFSRDQR